MFIRSSRPARVSLVRYSNRSRSLVSVESPIHDSHGGCCASDDLFSLPAKLKNVHDRLRGHVVCGEVEFAAKLATQLRRRSRMLREKGMLSSSEVSASNAMAANSVVLAGFNADDPALVDRWMDILVEEEADVNSSTFGRLLALVSREGGVHAADWWFSKMSSSNPVSDHVRHRLALHARCVALHSLEAKGLDHKPVSEREAGIDKWLSKFLGVRGFFKTDSIVIACQEAFGALAAKGRDPQRVVAWNHRVSSVGYDLGVRGELRVLRAHVREGNVKAADAVVSRILENDSDSIETQSAHVFTSLNLLLRSCAVAGDVFSAEASFERMISESCEPDHVSYGHVLQACSSAQDKSKAESWLLRMVREGLVPSCVEFSTLLHIFARAGDVPRVELWLQRIDVAEEIADTYCHNALIVALNKVGDCDAAAKKLESMSQGFDFRPDAASFGNTASAFSSNGRQEEAEALLTEAMRLGCPPDDRVYCGVIRRCAFSGDVARAGRLLKQMEVCGLRPSTRALLDILGACSPPYASLALQIFTKLDSAGNQSSSTSAASLNVKRSAARAFAQMGDVVGVCQIFGRKRENNPPNSAEDAATRLAALANVSPRRRQSAMQAACALIDFGDGLTMPASLRAALGGRRVAVRRPRAQASNAIPKQILDRSHIACASRTGAAIDASDIPLAVEWLRRWKVSWYSGLSRGPSRRIKFAQKK